MKVQKDGKETVLKITRKGNKEEATSLHLQAPPEELAFSPDRKWLAYLAAGKLHLWRWQAGGKPFSVALPGTAQWLAFESHHGFLLVSTDQAVYFLQSNLERVRGWIGIIRSLMG